MSYKKQFIQIEDILVNPKNPRFEPVQNQQKAIEVMLENMKHKVKNLARDIADNGLNPTKHIYVLKSSRGKYVVLEGNRRLVAIKLINNPSIVKNDNNLRRYFQQLKDTIKNFPKKFNCIVFDNKEEANHWIELEHTGENKGVGQVPWDSEQKSRFKSNPARYFIKVIDFMRLNNITLVPGHATNIERLLGTSGVKEKNRFSF